jgi:hypothetical protein
LRHDHKFGHCHARAPAGQGRDLSLDEWARAIIDALFHQELAAPFRPRGRVAEGLWL